MRSRDEQIRELVERLLMSTRLGHVTWSRSSASGVFELRRPSGTVILSGGSAVVSPRYGLTFLNPDGHVIFEHSSGVVSLAAGPGPVSPTMLQELYQMVEEQLNSADPTIDEFLREL
jgi:hypothetical protein